MNPRHQFPARWTFWESFAKTIDSIAQCDQREAERMLFAIFEYGSWGKEPDFGSNYRLAATFEALRPNIDNSVKACASGIAGAKKKAAKKQQQAAEKEPAEEEKEKDMTMTNDEKKRLRKLSKAMGSVYRETVVPGYEDDDDRIPNWVFENEAACYFDEEEERQRKALEEAIAREAFLG